MRLRGIGLTSFAIFSHIHPVLVISKPKLRKDQKDMLKLGDGDIKNLGPVDWIKVYQSPNLDGGDLLFPMINIESSKLCGGSLELPIKVNYTELINLIDFSL